jgi:hypothetical protein
MQLRTHHARLGHRLSAETPAETAAATDPQRDEESRCGEERDPFYTELARRGLSDHYETGWGDGNIAMAHVCLHDDSPTTMALRIWGTDIPELFVTPREDLEGVAITPRRESGESGETVIGVPCGVLGDPGLLLSEAASDVDIESLRSHADVQLEGGRRISASVVRRGFPLVLEVLCSDAPTVVIAPYDAGSGVLSIEPRVRRLGGEREAYESFLQIWVPKDVLSGRRT